MQIPFPFDIKKKSEDLKNNWSFPWSLKANALQYTLIVGVIIFVLVLVVMMYFHVNTLLGFSTDKKITEIHKHKNALLGASNQRTITINSKPWGGFTIDKTIAKNDGFSQTAMSILSFIDDEKVLQIDQLETNNYLQISGKSKIDGNIRVPYGQIKTTSAGGRIYEGENLNNLQLSASGFSKQKHPMEDYLFSAWIDIEGDSLLTDLPQKACNSFKNRTATYLSNQTIVLYDQELTGNLKIVSPKKIVVYSSTKFTDVLLVAPVIEVKSNTQLTGHLVARDSISIHNKTKFNFPSSITITTSATADQPLITIDENVVFNGVINQFKRPEPNRLRPNIIINENSTIDGYVFNNGYTSLKGRITGGIFTNEFLALERGSVYRNYIIDGEVAKPDNQDLLNALKTSNNSPKIPVQWMY